MPSLLIESLPEALHARLTQVAAQHHRSLTEEVIVLLEKELNGTIAPPHGFFPKRVVSPEFARLEALGAFAPKAKDRDVTELISEDRDGN